jgi:ABC-type branched-subunit amino acid transport system permease subunit
MAENREKKPTDYTGLIIAAILVPVFLLFMYFGNEDLGRTVFIALGAVMVAIRIRWDLRRQLWFWETIGFVLVLHIPFFYLVRIPPAWFHSVAMLPIVIPDCLLTVGIIRVVEKFHERNSRHSAPV